MAWFGICSRAAGSPGRGGAHDRSVGGLGERRRDGHPRRQSDRHHREWEPAHITTISRRSDARNIGSVPGDLRTYDCGVSLVEPDYQPYQGGAFRWRLGLRALDLADWIQIGPAYERDMAAKRDILARHPGTVLSFVQGIQEEASEVLHALVHHLTNRWPQWFTRDRRCDHEPPDRRDVRARRPRNTRKAQLGRHAAPARHRRPARPGGSGPARRARRGAGRRRRVGVLPEPLGPGVEARPPPRRRARAGLAAQRPTRRLGRDLLRTPPARSQLLAPRVVGARHRRAVPTDGRHGAADRTAPRRRRSARVGRRAAVPTRRARDVPPLPRHALRAVHVAHVRAAAGPPRRRDATTPAGSPRRCRRCQPMWPTTRRSPS